MERLRDNNELRTWSDHIPLTWKYTAGVAGDRFIRTLKQGKIQGSLCKNCRKTFVPPKIFCKDCFKQLDDWIDIPSDSAYVYSFTSAGKSETKETDILALIKFDDVEGGLLGKLRLGQKEEAKLDMRVRAIFKPKDARRGDLSDILYFEKNTSQD